MNAIVHHQSLLYQLHVDWICHSIDSYHNQELIKDQYSMVSLSSILSDSFINSPLNKHLLCQQLQRCFTTRYQQQHQDDFIRLQQLYKKWIPSSKYMKSKFPQSRIFILRGISYNFF